MKETTAENIINYTIENEDGYVFFITENRVQAYEQFEWYKSHTTGTLYLKKNTQTTITEILDFDEQPESTVGEMLHNLRRKGIDTSKLTIKEEEDE